MKYLRSLWRSLESTKYCVLSAAGADNVNANSNNISFTMKTQNDIKKLTTRQGEDYTTGCSL